MTNDSADFMTHRHKQLITYANVLNAAAWVILIIYGILTLSNGISSLLNEIFTAMSSNLENIIVEILVRTFTRILDLVLTGGFLFLCLRALSLGLNMIVETDLNYRGKAQENTNV